MPLDPVTASINATGRVAAAAISSYRPVGVPRTGSKEDRAAAYRRFLDASVALGLLAHAITSLHDEAGKAAEPYIAPLFPRLTDLGGELVAALEGLRLCAPLPVLDAAEKVGRLVPTMNLPAAEFESAVNAYVAARRTFVAAARDDLAYNPRWWQILRKWKERRHLKRSETAPELT